MAGTDEFEVAGLTKAPSRLVRPPRVAESPVQFECVYMQTLRLPGGGMMGTVDVVFGRVVAVHVAEWALTPDGRIDVPRLKPLARFVSYAVAGVANIVLRRNFDGLETSARLGASTQGGQAAASSTSS